MKKFIFPICIIYVLCFLIPVSHTRAAEIIYNGAYVSSVEGSCFADPPCFDMTIGDMGFIAAGVSGIAPLSFSGMGVLTDPWVGYFGDGFGNTCAVFDGNGDLLSPASPIYNNPIVSCDAKNYRPLIFDIGGGQGINFEECFFGSCNENPWWGGYTMLFPHIYSGVCAPGTGPGISPGDLKLAVYAGPYIPGIPDDVISIKLVYGEMEINCCTDGDLPIAPGVCADGSAVPDLGVAWEGGGGSKTVTLTEGQTVLDLGLIYANIGESGSVVEITGCEIDTEGIDGSKVNIDCPTGEDYWLVKP